VGPLVKTDYRMLAWCCLLSAVVVLALIAALTL
jgi:hypothetical protein